MFAFTIYIYIFKVLNFWKNTSLLSEFIMVPCTWWQKNDDQSSSFHCTIVQFLIYLPAGYNYYGTERMYSGVDGREFEADIFFGVVYYQRLRHMVADKYQVINSPPTHPPIPLILDSCLTLYQNVSNQCMMTNYYACHLIGSNSGVTWF